MQEGRRRRAHLTLRTPGPRRPSHLTGKIFWRNFFKAGSFGVEPPDAQNPPRGRKTRRRAGEARIKPSIPTIPDPTRTSPSPAAGEFLYYSTRRSGGVQFAAKKPIILPPQIASGCSGRDSRRLPEMRLGEKIQSFQPECQGEITKKEEMKESSRPGQGCPEMEERGWNHKGHEEHEGKKRMECQCVPSCPSCSSWFKISSILTR